MKITNTGKKRIVVESGVWLAPGGSTIVSDANAKLLKGNPSIKVTLTRKRKPKK